MSDSYSERQRQHWVVRLLLVLLFMIWSLAFTAIKHMREILTPMELISARFLPAALFCSLFLFLKKGTREESLKLIRKAPLRLTAMGLFGVAGYNYFLFLGQSEIKPGAAALLTTLSPLFTLLPAIIFLKEKVPLRRVLGIALALAGLYVVVRWGRVGLGRMTGISNAEVRYAMITSLAPLSWTIYTILGKNLTGKHRPLLVTYISIIIGSVPFLFVLNRQFFETLLLMQKTHWIALFHLSALCTLAGFWIWNMALRYLPATSVASFIYLNPPFAVLFGWLFFGEEITLLFMAGSAVVLMGLYLAQSRK